MSFVSFAQNAEDLMLWRALRHVERGFWIDVGAADPDEMSVTRAFHDRGWTGVNIEPSAHYFDRLRSGRPQDVNLAVALGAAPGSRPFHIIVGTGLSTLNIDIAEHHRRAGFSVETGTIEIHTLAEICRWHAPPDVHFLKIDVEGAEAEVLAGADFTRHRPWIVLVEATLPLTAELSHAAWEDTLFEAGYTFVWFDGINRFYVAREHEALVPSLRVPPNHLDDWTTAADHARAEQVARLTVELEAARRAQARAERERETQSAAIATAQAARDHAVARQLASETEAAWLRRSLDARTEPPPIPPSAVAPTARAHALVVPPRLRRRLVTSGVRAAWRLTGPVIKPVAWRTRTFLTAELRADLDQLLDRHPRPSLPAPLPGSTASRPISLPRAEPAATNILAVHQFHPSVTSGDAITNGMFHLRRILRNLGFESQIFVRNRDPGLAHEVWLVQDLPNHPDYVLMVHHSLGDPDPTAIVDLPCPKVLVYHNITPPNLLGDPFMSNMAELGRDQLASWRTHFASAIADSSFNALELTRLGYATALASQTLFDPDALVDAARAAKVERPVDAPFTILFVGRIVESKGQADLVEAFARFRQRHAGQSRLVLIGRTNGGSEAYEAEIRRKIIRNHLEDAVILTGAVDDPTLHGWYAQADLYASMSLHEGFGVPLVEAMAHGVPIVALATGAVAFTVGNAGLLIETSDPDGMVDAMLTLANDAGRRDRVLASQREQLARFRLPAQLPLLIEALALAGARRRSATDINEVRRALHVTIAGHVNGSYSLAAVNRGLALALNEAVPGRVRVLPVEGLASATLHDVPAAEWTQLETLVTRPDVAAAPLVVISHHYPVWVPETKADLHVALFFWEETLISDQIVTVLNENFDAVLAPSQFVARALMDSGVVRPVRVVGQPVELSRLLALPGRPSRPSGAVFTFLHVSSGFPRKGVDLLLSAWVRAFGADEAVRLVIKTFPNPHNDVAARIDDLRARHPGMSEVIHLDEDLSADRLLTLYEGADAMVLPTRGEGFNLPAAEAMAAGVPLIVSIVGGHRDFVGPEQAILVEGRHDASRSHVAVEGALWFEPDQDELVAALRRVVDSPDEAQAMAIRARHAIRERLDRRIVAGRLVNTLAELLSRPEPTPVTRLAVVTSWGIRCGIAEYSALLLSNLPNGTPSPVILADDRTHAFDGGLTVLPTWSIGDKFDAAALASAIARVDPEILMIQHQPGLIAWSQLPVLLNDPRVRNRTISVTLHNTRDLTAMEAIHRAALVEALAPVRTVVHTSADLDRLRSFHIHATMIPHGATPADPKRKPAVRTLFPTQAPLIGTYGFLLAPKGFGPLIEALKIVRQTWPGAKLRMVTAIYDEGPSEVEHHGLLDYAEKIGLGAEIDWHTGFLARETSLELLRGCDLLVLPYRPTGEAASGALHTALASLVPTAVTPVDIFREAGEAVWRLSGIEPDAMATGIITLLQDADRRAALVDRQETWLEKRSWERIATRTIAMLNALANEHTSASSVRANLEKPNVAAG